MVMKIEEGQLDTRMGDAESGEGRGVVGTARAVLVYTPKCYPDRKGLWRWMADLEKAHGTRCTSFLSSLICFC